MNLTKRLRTERSLKSNDYSNHVINNNALPLLIEAALMTIIDKKTEGVLGSFVCLYFIYFLNKEKEKEIFEDYVASLVFEFEIALYVDNVLLEFFET